MLWIESVPSTRCQVRKTSEEDDRVEDRRGDVGDAEADVEDVGAHRPEDADHRHRQPVAPGHVAVAGELQVEGDDEGDAAEDDGDLGHQPWTRKSEVDSPIPVVSALTIQKIAVTSGTFE